MFALYFFDLYIQVLFILSSMRLLPQLRSKEKTRILKQAQMEQGLVDKSQSPLPTLLLSPCPGQWSSVWP